MDRPETPTTTIASAKTRLAATFFERAQSSKKTKQAWVAQAK